MTDLKVNVIAAGCEQKYPHVLGIGLENKLPWNIPEDLIRFKRMTLGHVVIMGRNTWESIPEKYRPLTGRVNIVISASMEPHEGIYVAENLKSAFQFARMYPDKQIFLIGGERVYSSFFRCWRDLLDKVYLTRILRTYEVDCYLDLSSIHEYLVLESSDPKEGAHVSKDVRKESIPYRYETYSMYKAP